MEPLRDFIQRLAGMGCRARLEGNVLVVSGIPDWKTRCEVEEALPQLAQIALVKEMFCRSQDRPPETEQEFKGNRCPHCIHFRLYRCTHRGNIPNEVFVHGCDRFKFCAVYF